MFVSFALVFMCFSGLSTVQADVLPAYYQAIVPVKTQSAEERKAAAKRGLAVVLVKISGDSSLKGRAGSLNANTAWSYVQSFQYDALLDEGLQGQGFQRNLQLSFDPSVIRKLLSDMNANFWPTSRPKILVWLVEDTSNSRRLINKDDSTGALYKGLRHAAMSRGLPLSYPLLDLEDQNKVSADEVWALNEAAIRDASARYSADVIFVGRVSKISSGRIRATWQFLHAGQSRFYDSQSQNYKQVGLAGLDPLADFLSQRYAIAASRPATQQLPGIVMHVSNVNGFADYRRLLDYFESQAVFNDIVVEEVSNNILKLRMQAQVPVSQIENTLALNNSLIPDVANSTGELPEWQQSARSSESSLLRYRWSN